MRPRGGICFRIMFQDNAGGYDEYTGKAGSDGDEAGDGTNKKKKKNGDETNLSGKNSVKHSSIFDLLPKKVNVNPTIDTQEEAHQANMGTHER